MAHKLSNYKDDNVSVPFCELCGSEGLDLFADCPGEPKIVDKSLKKNIDNKMEQD